MNAMDFNFPIYETGLSFSPDSRYLAFLTSGEVQMDANNWPVSVITMTDQVFINLLDLQDQRLLWSAPASKWSDLSWSPASSYLAYQNQSEDWQLVDIRHQKILPVTKAGGSNVYRLEWSFDGRYLSLLACYILPNQGCDYNTVIFDVTRGIMSVEP